MDGSKFCPDILDVGIHGSIQAGFGLLPYQIHQLIPRIDVPRMPDERLENVVFVAGKLQKLPMVGDLAF